MSTAPDLYVKCLYGYTPFVCENREDTKAKILVSLSLLRRGRG